MAEIYERAKRYTEKYRSILPPCKYCGNTDIRVVVDKAMFPARYLWGVCCSTPKCDCTAACTSAKEAVTLWIERHGDKDIEQKLR